MNQVTASSQNRYAVKSVGARLSLVEKAVWHARALALGFKRLVFPIRHTHRYPYVRAIPSARNYRGMIVLLDEKCNGCSLCARVCPAAALKMITVEQGEKRPVINYERCVFCGYCVDICPTEALYHTNVHDLVFMNRDSMIFMLDRFTKEPEEPEHVKKVRVVLDEERGLRYVPVGSDSE
uniref:NADH-quinone oxidoreductase subunit I n=1 Tax=Fervidicoccus fontis TaxID=683846 RepID=A0A7J3ZLU2_9CREN